MRWPAGRGGCGRAVPQQRQCGDQGRSQQCVGGRAGGHCIVPVEHQQAQRLPVPLTSAFGLAVGGPGVPGRPYGIDGAISAFSGVDCQSRVAAQTSKAAPAIEKKPRIVIQRVTASTRIIHEKIHDGFQPWPMMVA